MRVCVKGRPPKYVRKYGSNHLVAIWILLQQARHTEACGIRRTSDHGIFGVCVWCIVDFFILFSKKVNKKN